MKTKEQIIKSLKRELGLRCAVYPKRVREGRMRQEDDEHEIECVREALTIVENSAHHNDPQQSLL